MSGSSWKSRTYDECAQDSSGQEHHAPRQFINPHRLFHGVWMPQWLEERPEVSEKAKPQKLEEHLSKRLDSDRIIFSPRLTHSHMNALLGCS